MLVELVKIAKRIQKICPPFLRRAFKDNDSLNSQFRQLLVYSTASVY